MENSMFPIKLDDCVIFAAGRNSTIVPLKTEVRCYKLLVVSYGQCILNMGGHEYELHTGESMLILPYEDCVFLNDDETECRYSYVSFSIDSDKYCSLFPDGRICDIEEMLCVICDENINGVVKNICEEIETEEKAFSGELISLLGSQMLVYLYRYYGIPKEKEIHDTNLKVCSQVMKYIDSRIYSMKNLREVAHEMGYNYSYISTLFRKTCGTTLNAYFKSKRMNEAKRLLQEKGMSVSEIAKTMNYSSVYAFSKAFKEHFGMSPGYYSGRFPKKD